MYSASAVSSLKRQAWCIRQALCALFPHPSTNVYLSPDASMQTQAAGYREVECSRRHLVCHTMVHSARTPTTRPLPRPAAIASRHATSRAMQVTSVLLVSQAAPAALSSPHSPCLSLSLSRSCKPTCKALHCHKHPEGREGNGSDQSDQKPEWITPL
jgi:hypothetical protein